MTDPIRSDVDVVEAAVSNDPAAVLVEVDGAIVVARIDANTSKRSIKEALIEVNAQLERAIHYRSGLVNVPEEEKQLVTDGGRPDGQREVRDLEPGTDVWRCRTFDGSRTAVHLDPDCPRIYGDEPTRKDPGVLQDDRRICSYCDPETPGPKVGGGSNSLSRALEREDVTELDQIADALDSAAEIGDEEAGA